MFHWVENDGIRDYVLNNGITIDTQGIVYLSVLPLYPVEYGGHVFEVKIPNSNNLVDWREVWCDEEGNEIDSDHEYNPNNPYYCYFGNIPKEYIKLLW